MMASSGPIMLAVLRLRGKTKFWMWERNVTWNKVMQGTHHLKTTLPSRRRCDEQVRGVSYAGARLWEAWQSVLCHYRQNTAKVSHQLLCLCCKSYTKLYNLTFILPHIVDRCVSDGFAAVDDLQHMLWLLHGHRGGRPSWSIDLNFCGEARERERDSKMKKIVGVEMKVQKTNDVWFNLRFIYAFMKLSF